MVAKTLQNKRSSQGKFSAIPHKTGSDQVMDAVASNLEQLTGMRGAGGKKAVLWEDLKGLGIAELKNGKSKTLIDLKRLASSRASTGNNTGGVITGGDVVETPTQPRNLVASSGFGVVTLTWDTAPYKGHAYTEIYQATEDNFSKSVRIDTSASNIDALPLPQKGDFYFWIKFINEKGAASPINSTNGTHAKSVVDTKFLLDLISGQLKLHPESLGLKPENLGIDLSKFANAEVVEKLDVLLAEAALENSLTTDEQTTSRRIENKELSATIKRDYYTAINTDSAIAAAVQQLKSSIEDPNGNSVMATLTSQYATKATLNKSVTSLTNKLKSEIGKVNATLKNDYATNTTLNNAISQAKTSLQSKINDLDSTLTTDYKTWADTNKAISQLRTSLTSAINNGGVANSNLKNTVAQLKSTLQQDYATKTEQSTAISNLKTALTSTINGVKSDSTKALNLVKSDLTQNYATKTSQTSAISSLRTSLSSSLTKDINTAASSAVADAKKETTKQVSSLSSNIAQSYVTKTSQGTALSNLSTTLTSSISKAAKSETTKQVNAAKAAVNKETTKQVTEAKAAAAKLVTDAKAAAAKLVADAKTSANNETTKQVTEAKAAAAKLVTDAKAAAAKLVADAKTSANNEITKQVNLLKATLKKDYFTKTGTNSAISQATTTLKTSLNGVSSSITTLKQSISNVKGGYTALWGVKADIGKLHAAVGLVAKSSKDNTVANAVFTIKNAGFRVVYDDGTGKEHATPIFGTVNNPDYTPKNGKPKQLLAINTASIKVANIKDLVTGSIVADSIVASSTISAPKLKTPTINDIHSKFYVDSTGHVQLRDVLIKSGSGASRMVITQDRIEVYENNHLRVRLGRL